MTIDINAIKEYLMSLETVSLQVLQKGFSLSYSEATEIVSELERQDAVSFVSGFTYKVHRDRIIAWDGLPSSGKKLDAINIGEDLLIRALRECIMSGNVSASRLQRKLSVGYVLATRLVERLNDLKLIDYNERKVFISAEEFNMRFGDKYKIDIDR